jgi:AcrR family transcriptional regulator
MAVENSVRSQTPARATKSRQKREQIKLAAMDLILELGYEAASLDLICKKAGCSKSAIYEHFSNKEGLLAALTEDAALELSEALHAFHLQGLSVEDTLRHYAELVLTRILEERHVAIVRSTIAALHKYPELGPAYYRVGGRTGKAGLTHYFAIQAAEGHLIIPDPEWAADEFQGILFWERLLAQIVGARSAPDEREIKEHSKRAVDSFLQRYKRDAG